MLSHEPARRWPSLRWAIPLLLFVLTPFRSALGQLPDETGYLPDKAYVIRLSPSAEDKFMLEANVGPWLEEQFVMADGMLDHFKSRVYPARSARDGSWYYVYFDPERQAKADLMHDNDLLVWFFHGHHIQIQPIEMLQSPAATLPIRTAMEKQ